LLLINRFIGKNIRKAKTATQTKK